MTDTSGKTNKLRARLPRGLADRSPAEIIATRRMLDCIRQLWERYGFEPVETPAIEYSDALGKFLPDQDRPNEGVFSFEDDDQQWLSLRYDLTAPLARYVAQNFDSLPKPYRSYRAGWVFRNEKPGPGRFRQFMQFDADTVGSASPAADAEIAMLAADTMEALGIARGSYVVKVSSRKLLDGLLEALGAERAIDPDNRLLVLRAIDKLDRLGATAVFMLLTKGRMDESGDFTAGAGLSSAQADIVLRFLGFSKTNPGGAHSEYVKTTGSTCFESLLELGPTGAEGMQELNEIAGLIACAAYNDRIVIDRSVVRGLEYYTGPVFEVELTFEMSGEDGAPIRFGSVGGGGRYDGLIARFRGEQVPATGFSIGVSRLMAALTHLGRIDAAPPAGPVVVTIFDRQRIGDYQNMVAALRRAGIRAELYLGTGRMGAQLKYADRRHSPCVVIQGEDEKARGEVQIKDLRAGSKAAASIASHEEWRARRPAQFAVREENLVAAVCEVLAGQNGGELS
jgi:histidyl-tRNA synthetase